MSINRPMIFGNVLFLIAVLCYFTASKSLALGIGAFGMVLEVIGIVQLVKAAQAAKQD